MSTTSVSQAANNILVFIEDSMWTDIQGQLAIGYNIDDATSITESAKEIARKHWDKEDLLGIATYSTAEILRECNLVDNQYVDNEVGKEAIRVLKQSGRIKQVGPGKGKAIILIDNTPIPTLATTTSHEEEVKLLQASPDELLPSEPEPDWSEEANPMDEVSLAIMEPVEIDIDINKIYANAVEYQEEDYAKTKDTPNPSTVVELLREATDEYRNLKATLDEATRALISSKKQIAALHQEIEKKNEAISEKDGIISDLKNAVITLNNKLEDTEYKSLHTWS